MISVDGLAELVGGTVRGDGSVSIHEVATLQNAQSGEITLAIREELVSTLRSSKASAAVVPRGFPDVTLPVIEVDDVETAFVTIVTHFRPPREFSIPPSQLQVPASCSVCSSAQIHSSATIGEDVVIGSGCKIHAGVAIGDGTTIGDDVTIFPHAILYENTIIGSRVIIHGGAVIGAYGFGYRSETGVHQLVAQLGHVEIEADVEIGACTTIDRGTYDATIIGEGTKIDNHVMIGHNCRIGRHNLICSLSGIAGSCRTGDYVVLAGQAGLSDHITLGNHAKIAAKSGVMQDVPEGETFAGLPAMPERDFWRMWVLVTRLPDMRAQFKSLQREMHSIKKELDIGRDAA